MTTETSIGQRVDVAFPLAGERVPQDHGYALFGALCRVLGDLHGAEWLAVHPINGLALPGAGLRLHARRSRLQLRVPVERIPGLLPLAGKLLDLDGDQVRVGAPTIYPLTQTPSLASRMVAIRMAEVDLKDDEGSAATFRASLQKQLDALEVSARVELGARRALRIREQSIVGWGVRLFELSPEHSLKVQAEGLGGRRRFGCGVFSGPVRPRKDD